MNSMPPIADLDLRRASLCQLLHWLAVGRVQPQALADVYQHGDRTAQSGAQRVCRRSVTGCCRSRRTWPTVAAATA